MRLPTFELADIVKQYKSDFLDHHKVSKQVLRTLGAIEKCRTAALGGHIDKCDSSACGHTRISYNSCRNRHCPKCQGKNRDQWVMDRQADLLPCTYYHLVFTMPSLLHAHCIAHPTALYTILFAASKETVEAFGKDPKHLGADMGMVSLLHTWGQNLSLHPHVHMIVPGGGFTPAGYWKNAKSEGKYLFPMKAMAIVYRTKFLQKLTAFLKANNQPSLTNELRQKLYHLNWVVYAKQPFDSAQDRPFGGPEQVIEYIGRYSHKIAISNHRIKNVSDGKVTFQYKDYADQSITKCMTLEASEFIRRFCLHILPPKFVKIRHYGILASRNKPALRMYQLSIGIVPRKGDISVASAGPTNDSAYRHATGVDQCPVCKKGRMMRIMAFDAHGPPINSNKTNISTEMKKAV